MKKHSNQKYCDVINTITLTSATMSPWFHHQLRMDFMISQYSCTSSIQISFTNLVQRSLSHAIQAHS